jgi:hypothetical protein
MLDQAADYKGEGGERAANNNGIRQRLISPPGREHEKIKKSSLRKNFFQQYGLSGWILCSRKNSQCALLILSVLFLHPLHMGWRNFFPLS